MLAQITPTHLRHKENVGGRDTLPPTSRLRAAYIAAHAAAYAEAPRQAVSLFFGPVQLTSPAQRIEPKAPRKEFRHARAVSG